MTVANRVAETGQTAWVRDAQAERSFKQSDSVTNLDLRTILCVPMKLEQEITGVIYVDSRYLMRTFTEEDLLMFEALSEHAARAIAKSRLYEETLEKARIEKENEELRALDRKKSDFINMLSHEFRTPLTVIQGYAERLKSCKVNESEQVWNHAVIIYDEAKRLSRLVDELLDLSRIKSGKQEIQRTECDLTGLIERAAETLKSKAEAKQLVMRLVYARKPILMTVDADKIYQLMLNLIDNAIKYTPERGLIQVLADEIPTLEVQENSFIASFAQISVTDTGLGISPTDKERIFDEFYRTNVVLGTKEKGTGLGLSICRGIVQAHGGRIWVESQPGKGSKFIFTLPNYQPISRLPEYKSKS
jgi:two-component system phosphate regulon sensor histidine kinase PhoR